MRSAARRFWTAAAAGEGGPAGRSGRFAFAYILICHPERSEATAERSRGICGFLTQRLPPGVACRPKGRPQPVRGRVSRSETEEFSPAFQGWVRGVDGAPGQLYPNARRYNQSFAPLIFRTTRYTYVSSHPRTCMGSSRKVHNRCKASTASSPSAPVKAASAKPRWPSTWRSRWRAWATKSGCSTPTSTGPTCR